MSSRARGAVVRAASTFLVFVCLLPAAARADDVPLVLWTNPSFPSGLVIGGTMGISWGDYDGDGAIDLFAAYSGALWRNVGGVTWSFAGDLSTLLPATERRYGSSFGDYDKDGRPDIAMSPRVPEWGDDRFHLLRNLGGAEFADVAGDPAILDRQPYGNAETLCWADVDGDRDLDLFVPAYPPPTQPGNFFFMNAAPTGPDGVYRFVESSADAGVDNTPGNARPEGAQFADVDFDGDPDLYSNGTLYQNVSTLSTPRFNALDESASGIGMGAALDEGAVLFDYDLDGDQDLVVAYADDGVRIWENAGDGTFFAAEPTIVDAPDTGLDLGMSAEDWDGDGDIDFTTRQVFRRNRLVEDGTRHFTVATHSIPYWAISNATPAWGDWDKDGDLDCAIGNWGWDGRLFENTLYGPATPLADRRTLRVRVVQDSATVPRGLETEYGATAEVRLLNVPDPFRRRKFVASSHGYLNQNEYTLSFGLPPDPSPADLEKDLRIDLSVDFPGLPSRGLWRVDKGVNPALGNISFAALADHEIQVSRCGEVRIDGTVHEPVPLASENLTTTSGGLALPAIGESLDAPTPAPPDGWIGLAFDTHLATQPLELREIVLDAELAGPERCGADPFNVALWDVTHPSHPALVNGGSLQLETSSRNRRSHLPVELTLEPGRSYRLVARVARYRHSTIEAALADGSISVRGGVAYKDGSPCSGQKAANAPIDDTHTAIALRYRPVPSSTALDPVGPTLRLARAPGGSAMLQWQEVGADAYRVLSCNAAAGPCVPAVDELSHENHFLAPGLGGKAQPRENTWYLVRAVNECAAGL